MSARTAIVPVVGAGLIRALGTTWRFQQSGEEQVEEARRHAPCVIFAFWHGRMLPLAYSYRGSGARILASRHADGELLGRTIRHLGFGHVRGSSSRGGARAILELVDAVRAGYDVGITVDGPRGPRHVVKPGVVELAKLTGCAIIPITTASRRHHTFGSWDAFQLPEPWTRVVVRRGAPVRVPADADRTTLEARRAEVERVLSSITREADRDAGV